MGSRCVAKPVDQPQTSPDLVPTRENAAHHFVYSEFNRLLEGQGAVHSQWQGPTETARYMYGDRYEAMRTALAGIIASYPLSARARVVQVA
jgi:hypothetical protein